MTATAAIFAPRGETLGRAERQFFHDVDPWGFILFARNIGTADQLRGLCADLRETLGRDAPILIDQEGGRVQRILPPLARRWRPPLTDVARLGSRAGEGMYLRARDHRRRAARLRHRCELHPDAGCGRRGHP